LNGKIYTNDINHHINIMSGNKIRLVTKVSKQCEANRLAAYELEIKYQMTSLTGELNKLFSGGFYSMSYIDEKLDSVRRLCNDYDRGYTP